MNGSTKFGRCIQYNAYIWKGIKFWKIIKKLKSFCYVKESMHRRTNMQCHKYLGK